MKRGKSASNKFLFNDAHRLSLYFAYHSASEGIRPPVNQAPMNTPHSTATASAERHGADRATHKEACHRPPANNHHDTVVHAEVASAKHAESTTGQGQGSTRGSGAENEVGNQQQRAGAEARQAAEGGEDAQEETDAPTQPVLQQPTAEHPTQGHPEGAPTHSTTPPTPSLTSHAAPIPMQHMPSDASAASPVVPSSQQVHTLPESPPDQPPSGAAGQHGHAQRQESELEHTRAQQKNHTQAQQKPDNTQAKTGHTEKHTHTHAKGHERGEHRTHPPQPDKTAHRKPHTPTHPHVQADDKQKHTHEKEHHRHPPRAPTDTAPHQGDDSNPKQHTTHAQFKPHTKPHAQQRHGQQHKGPAHHKYPYAGAQHTAAPPPPGEQPTPAHRVLPDLVSAVCYWYGHQSFCYEWQDFRLVTSRSELHIFRSRNCGSGTSYMRIGWALVFVLSGL